MLDKLSVAFLIRLSIYIKILAADWNGLCII